MPDGEWNSAPKVACVAGVRNGRGRELGRETTRPLFPSLLPRAPLAFLSRPKLPFSKLPFPSLSNACHAGYSYRRAVCSWLRLVLIPLGVHNSYPGPTHLVGICLFVFLT